MGVVARMRSGTMNPRYQRAQASRPLHRSAGLHGTPHRTEAAQLTVEADGPRERERETARQLQAAVGGCTGNAHDGRRVDGLRSIGAYRTPLAVGNWGAWNQLKRGAFAGTPFICQNQRKTGQSLWL